MGAVLAPTDPAILIPLFVRSRLRPKVSQTVIAESAFNDPTGAALALTLAGVVLTGDGSLAGPAGEFLVDLGISTVIGMVAGVVLAAAISSDRSGIWRESPRSRCSRWSPSASSRWTPPAAAATWARSWPD